MPLIVLDLDDGEAIIQFADSNELSVGCASGVIKPPILLENHLRVAEMSTEDDYCMFYGIINNGKASGATERLKKKKRP